MEYLNGSVNMKWHFFLKICKSVYVSIFHLLATKKGGHLLKVTILCRQVSFSVQNVDQVVIKK